MRQIKIEIPEKRDFIRWAKIAQFKLTGGFSCTKCGSKSNFNTVQFDSEIHGKRLIFQNSTQGICPECTKKELNEKADVVFTEDNCTCDWCKESKPTMSFPRDETLESSVHFGAQWWNGHHMCQDCMNIGFDNRGPTHSSVFKHEHGKTFMKNELGLWIERK